MLFDFVFLITLISATNSAKILCIFPVPLTNYAQVYHAISKELSLRGHQVMVITANPINDDSLSNLTEIEISTLNDIHRRNKNQKEYISKGNNLLTMYYSEIYYINYVDEVLSHINSMFPDPTTKFNLIIVENIHRLIFALRCRFNTSIIAIDSSDYHHLGNPSGTMVDFLFPAENGITYETTKNLIFRAIVNTAYNLYYSYQMNKRAKYFFGQSCYVSDILKNVNIISTENSMIHPTLPTFAELSNSNKILLPLDLQTYLDQSRNGVIFIDLGSTLSNLIKDRIYQTALDLPYDVLWKFDGLENNENNIVMRKNVPKAVFRHPKVKVFITQDNPQSIEEAAANCVPFLIISSSVEGNKKIKHLVEEGSAESIDVSTVTKHALRQTITEIATNKKYKEKIKIKKNLLLDQPMKLNKTIWWIEYIIRHKIVPSSEDYSYQHFLLDLVVAVLTLFGAVLCFTLLFVKIVKLITVFCPGKVKDKEN